MFMTPDWIDLPLEQLNADQWEALCDRCGRCCVHKLIDDETEELFFTRVACKLFNAETCSCQDYQLRLEKVPSCLQVSLSQPEVFGWLPSTCSYRLRFEGKPLPHWHPLLNEDNNAMIEAGVSLKGQVISEESVSEAEHEDYIVSWK